VKPNFPLMIFAAGLGTRMGPLTKNQPKPLIKVGGKALIDHTFDTVKDAPVSRIVVNLHYHADMLKKHLSGRNILFSDERDALLETGGGLRKAMKTLETDPVFTMNSDAIWNGPDPLAMLRDAWDGRKMDALLLLIDPEQALGHKGAGDFLLESNGQISRGKGKVYSGAQILRTTTLNDINEDAFSLNKLWDIYAAKGRLYGLHWKGSWCDVGQPESIPLAETILRKPDV